MSALITIIAFAGWFCVGAYVAREYWPKTKPMPAPVPVIPPACYHPLFSTINSQIYRTAEPWPVTIVLKRCVGCGAHASPCLAGEWTLPVLLRKESEITELERIAQ